MDIVYVTKDGENPELRYSLRSLRNLTHGPVWIFGGAPSWINMNEVRFVANRQLGTPYSSTRSHIAAACQHPAVSDPFILFNDDFFAVRPVPTIIAPMHRGPIAEVVTGSTMTPWWKGLAEAHVLLERMGFENPLCYDLHVPIVVHKNDMMHALRLAKKARHDAFALRTVYGNIANLGGTKIEDPKMMSRKDPFPRGPWLSSRDGIFTSTVEPVLRYLFPNPSHYEKV